MKLTSVQLDFAGDTLASHETRSVCRPAWNIELPLFQFAPIDGSPASPPSPFGAGSVWKGSGSLPAGGCRGADTGTRSAPAGYLLPSVPIPGANGAAATGSV